MLGTVALYLAARPGTAPEVFRRRVRAILVAVGILVVVVGGAAVIAQAGDPEPLDLVSAPAVLSVLLVPFLLVRANRSIAAVHPAPAGVRDRSGLGLLLVVALIVGVLGGRLAWSKVLGPEARALRAAEAERDRIAHRIGIGSIGAGHYVHSTAPGQCSGGEEGFISEGYADPGRGGLADAARQAERVLADLGYRVSTGQSSMGGGTAPDPWVYGLKPDRSVTVRTSSDAVFVSVTRGCRNRQLESAGP